MAKRKQKKRGRPREGRVPFISHVMPKTAKLIDGLVERDCPQRNSRGKILEARFNIKL